MNRRAQVSLFNLLCRYSFLQYPRPTSSSMIDSSSTILSPEPPIPSTTTSNFHSFSTIIGTHFTTQHDNMRNFSSGPELDQNKEVDMFNLKYAEAKEAIEMALESKDTSYFDEEAKCACAAVNEVVGMFEGLLARLPESDRAALLISMGLKIEQLKAELKKMDA